MLRLRFFRPILLVALTALLAGCGNGSPDAGTPADAYESFFVELNRGNRQDALEQLAPAGVLGDTFRGGAYYSYADAVEAEFDRHEGLDEVLIDETGEVNENTVRVEGRLRFRDGSELERRITFIREDDVWVGQL